MRSLRAFISRLRGRPVLRQHACCAFCERGYAVAAPFAEGPRSVFICGLCAETCAKLIADERSRPEFVHSTTASEIIRKRMQFSIRDLLWLTLVAAILLAWLMSYRTQVISRQTELAEHQKALRQGMLVLHDLNHAPTNPTLWTVEDALSDIHDPVANQERLRVAKLRLEAILEHVEERLEKVE